MALAQRFIDQDVNGLPRIGQDNRQIVTIEDFLFVKKSEIATLRQFTNDAIQATIALTEEINAGLFVATLLGGPNDLKEAKTALGFGRLKVSNLFFTGAKATGIAVGDIFPLGFEFLLDAKTGTPVIVSPDNGPMVCGVGGLSTILGISLLFGLMKLHSRGRRQLKDQAT